METAPGAAKHAICSNGCRTPRTSPPYCIYCRLPAAVGITEGVEIIYLHCVGCSDIIRILELNSRLNPAILIDRPP